MTDQTGTYYNIVTGGVYTHDSTIKPLVEFRDELNNDGEVALLNCVLP